MIFLLLTLSFIIHIILLLAMYSFYEKIKELKDEHANTYEIAEVFEKYLEKIKAENKCLENKYLIPSSALSKEEHHIDREKETKPSTINSFDYITENCYKLKEFDIRDELNTTLESQVIQLASQGYISNQIAEKLDCGKTEAELIIKLHTKRKA